MARKHRNERNGTTLVPAHPLANCRPLEDRIVARREERKGQSEGGIILPETAQTTNQIVTIVRVGPGKMLADGTVKPLPVRKGDRVVIGSYAGFEVRDGFSSQDEYLILRYEDVLAVLEDE